MSQKYALPCHCGNVITVEARHAGSTMPCEGCGASLDVPKLRQIRALEPIEEAPAKKRAGWSQLQGSLFALGLLMLAIAIGASLYTYSYRTTFQGITKPEDEDIYFELDIQEISLVDSWQSWNQFKNIKLDSRPQPLHVFARQRIAMLNWYLICFAVLAVAGLILMIASLLIRPGAGRGSG